MSGVIAVIDGHDLKEDRARTLILLSIVGDSAKEILKQAGVKIGHKLTEKVVMQIPGKVLIEINKKWVDYRAWEGYPQAHDLLSSLKKEVDDDDPNKIIRCSSPYGGLA